MKWFKRFVRYLFQEEERQQRFEREDKPIERTNAEIDVKVAYQYPTGKFRFPLIPDELSSRQPYDSPVVLEEEIEITLNRGTAAPGKRPFRPTEVPSPIYGYKERPKQREETKIEQEHPLHEIKPMESSLSTKGDTEETWIIQENEETEEVPARNEQEPQQEKMSDDVPKEPIRENGTEQLAVLALDEKEQDKQLENENGSFQTVSEQETTKAEERRISSRIPYNVMMLKQDRKKLEEKKKEAVSSGYRFPPLELLQPPQARKEVDEQWLSEQRERLNETFQNFNIGAKVVGVTQGPTVTRFEVQPAPGVKVSKITSLSDDIKLSLAAKDIRIEAPISGKSTIGIEVPNAKSRPVFIREILQSEAFRTSPTPLAVALGLDLSGAPVVTDLKKMPHGLIAGATGSGKSVCINAMLVSLLYKAAPHEVKLLLIDPKMVELAPYNHIPHLVSPVITDAKAATGALKWAVDEMERRYELFVHAGVRDIQKYNELVKKEQTLEHYLPYIVIIIDELADLMMVAPADVEEAICRIAQKARACGIHLIVATQRPSVDVITGLIKANIPTRIAFSVSSQVDSRTIIDTNGAEKLLGRGDMLFLENGTSKTVRIQGNFVSDEEIERVVAHVREQMPPAYLFEQEDFLKQSALANDGDELFYEACEFVVQQGGASTSSLQRRFRIGYNRAARLIEMMEEQGIISEARGSKPRDVLITEEELAQLQENSTP
ncbi:S-DNA-T family DNA segregation ATPase FtsK/SpoIIIE [Anoxybacillus tepidamans]|uniref:S-DNA-T family DNA segregation ATPase FtsK/SpoIIIE n=1 Tax=Anoxybacteroides tepidamans TaxID=265948 RepID=A0A7W8IPP3_9BACL|nr:DNA translocase FtsK [Anoxybacillus tepidamans]MBB5324456.1 S-DNA-T family DNA segregation ATPase FtsK/SpoIIIE [Anoxybacillus tepidamans]